MIGNRADIENVPIDKLQAFYKKFYQPDNAVLTVSGKITEATLLPLIGASFGPVPKPARTLETTYTVEPAQDGEKQVMLRRVGDIQVVLAVYHVPAGSDPDFAPIDVMMAVLADAPAGRLYKALVDTKKAVQVVGFGQQLNDPGTAIFGAIVNKQDSLQDARTIMLDTINSVAKEPPTKDDVDRARTRLLSNIDLQLRNSEQIGLTMSEWLSRGDWRLLYLHRDRLRKVTPEDVQRVAKAYLKTSNLTVAEFIPDATPDRAEIPPKADVAAMLKDYKGDAAMAQGEAFDPSPANIEARVLRRHASVRVEAVPAVETDARQHRERDDPPALRIARPVGGTEPGGRTGDADADARHAEEEPAADPGRARPPQGARERRRRRDRRHRVDRNGPGEPAGGSAAGGRGASRAGLPRRGIRSDQEAAADERGLREIRAAGAGDPSS